jgi:type I restriction enzyme S subunit
MSWEKVRLEEICKIGGGTTPSTSRAEFWNGNIIWLSPVDLPEVGTISHVNNSARKITAEAIKCCSLEILPINSIVFSSRASIGKIGIVQQPLCTNQGFTNLIPSEKIYYKYLAYVLKHNIQNISKLGNSTTFNEVSRTAFKNFKIPLPSLATQKRIAEILDAADALRRKDQELLRKYDELAQAIFIDMFGDPVKNEKGWEVKRIDEICNVTKLAGYEYTEHIKYKDVGEIAVIRGLNVKNEKLKLHDVKFIDRNISDNLKRSKLYIGDVVMTYIGVNIGDVAIIESNDKYHLAPNVAKITPKFNEVLNSFYLLKFLAFSKSQFEKYTTNTAKQALNMGNIRELKMMVPNIELQNEYERKYLNLREQVEISTLKSSEKLFNSLIQKAFNCELVA